MFTVVVIPIVSKRAHRLVRVLRGVTTAFIVLSVLAFVLLSVILIRGLVGGSVTLPLHVLLAGHTVSSGSGANHMVGAITSAATQVNVSIRHAPVGAVLLSGISNLITLVVGVVCAVIIRGALVRLESGQPFSGVVARSLTVVAVVGAIDGLISDFTGWLAEVQFAGTMLSIGGRTYATSIVPWAPDLSALYFAGLVFVIALVIRIGTAMQSELEQVV